MALLNDFQIISGSGAGGTGSAYRREERIVTGRIPNGQHEKLQLTMGRSVTLLKLAVSDPCLIRIFGKQDFSDPNPFEFLAYPNYLTYEGAVWDTLGTVWGNNRYPTLANKDKLTTGNLYIEVANPYDTPVEVTMDLEWLVLEA